jgi:small subunit ribosomal protein S15
MLHEVRIKNNNIRCLQLKKRLYSASSRAVATAPSAPSPSSSSSRALLLHTSAVLNVESARKRQARLTRQKNLAKRAELQKKAAAVRPHVILGTVVGDDAKWAACDLARILVRPEELAPDAAPQRVPLPTASASASSEAEAGAGADETTAPASAEVRVPGALAFGLRAREQRMLFQHLPLLAADMHARREMGAQPRGRARRGDGWEGHADVTDMAAQHGAELARGAAQADALGRVVDLRNANAAGIAFEDRRRIIAAFSGAGRVNDTGRTEVQGACFLLVFSLACLA